VEIIPRSRFWLGKWYSHIAIELLGEIITIIDSENSVEDVQIAGKIEIFPCIVIGEFANDFGNFLSF
jgi:hypothetical protein